MNNNKNYKIFKIFVLACLLVQVSFSKANFDVTSYAAVPNFVVEAIAGLGMYTGYKIFRHGITKTKHLEALEKEYENDAFGSWASGGRKEMWNIQDAQSMQRFFGSVLMIISGACLATAAYLAFKNK